MSPTTTAAKPAQSPTPGPGGGGATPAPAAPVEVSAGGPAAPGSPVAPVPTAAPLMATAPDAEQVQAAATPLVVRVEKLGKRFRIYARPMDRLREWLHLGGPRHTDFWALKGISFEVRRGECLGIIGANGSGKSTLLKIVTGAMTPTEGSASVQGRVLSLIELGTGLNPLLTGRANIVNSAALLGFPADFARQKMAEIEAFADLGDFFGRQVTLYSSGMKVRLAFSMFACFRPEVFIVDEALSVGDVFFQQKCTTRLRELLETGMTMIFVSHDQSAVLNLCDRAMLLQRGVQTFYGSPAEAVSRYNSALTADPGKRWARPAAAGIAPAASGPAATVGADAAAILARDVIGTARDRRHGTGALEIVAARIVDAAGRDARQALMGETLTFQILVRAREDVPTPRVGIRFHDRFNNLVFGAGTFQQGYDVPPLAAGERLVVKFEITMDVQPGEYTFGLGTGEPDPEHANRGIAHDRIDLLGPLTVGHPRNSVRPFYGVARLPMRVSHAAAAPDNNS